MSKHIRSVLITDLDNTLWNWVEIWYASFSITLSEVIRTSGLNESMAIELIKEIHTSAGTSEYSNLIFELEENITGNQDIKQIRQKYARLFKLQKTASKNAMKPFKNVVSSLSKIKMSGATIIGYTESMASPAINKVKLFNLDGVIDVIYAREDSKSPTLANYSLEKSLLRKLPLNAMKPDQDMLKNIIKDAEALPIDCAYLGDNLIKDIQMAKDVNVLDIFAKYGNSQKNSREYELLKKVTHWTPNDVQEESRTTSREILPTITLTNCISEIFSFVEFRELTKLPENKL